MGSAVHSRKYVVKIGTQGAPSVVTDRSNNFKTLDFDEAVDMAESTAFQDTDKTFEVGFKDNKFSGGGNWTAALDGHLGALLGFATPVAFELGPQGSATGNVKYTGNCYCTSFKKSGAQNALVSFTADFQISGAVTRATY
jgi:hypothetical protein